MKQIFAIMAIQAIFTAGLAFATDDGDLYPNIPVAASKVKGEYELAAKAFSQADTDAAKVMAAVNPGSLSCIYYMGNYRRKDGADLVVSKGRIGSASRSLTILGMPIQVMNPRHKAEGPWIEAKIQNVKYKLELRMGRGDAEGTLLIAIGQTDGGFNFNKSQYLVCDVGGASEPADEAPAPAEGTPTASDLQP